MTPALVALLVAVALGGGNLVLRILGHRRLALVAGHLVFAVGGVAALAVASLRASDPTAWLAIALFGVAVPAGAAVSRLRSPAGASLALMLHILAALLGVFAVLAAAAG